MEEGVRAMRTTVTHHLRENGWIQEGALHRSFSSGHYHKGQRRPRRRMLESSASPLINDGRSKIANRRYCRVLHSKTQILLLIPSLD